MLQVWRPSVCLFLCPPVTLVDCDHTVQQKWKWANKMIGPCLGFLYAEADPDRNILWSSILLRKTGAARRLRIDVHDNNDNAWQRGPLWPHGMGPMTTNESACVRGRVSYIRICLCYFCFRWKTVSLVHASMQHLMHHVTVSLQQSKITLQNNCINNTSITQPTLSFYLWLKM